MYPSAWAYTFLFDRVYFFLFCFLIVENEKVEEKPLLTSSLSLPDGSTKNKFLSDIMASQA